MRSKFDQQLTLLNNSLVEMGALVERAIANAVKALIERDTNLARLIIAADDEIDSKDREIESLCIKLLLHQQPVASDLRLITAAMKMITDLERIGDHASDISELTLLLADMPYHKNLEHISQMAEATAKMIRDSINAFVKKDLKLAEAVIAYDDEVDDLFVTVKNDMLTLIGEDPKNGDQAIDLIMVAKYFERIGDHATNIAEWTIFSIAGTHKIWET
ncbi:MAG: phosphate signaling complex protein PhoU [Oscillospiraceae bacterium]|nr:phosphate signaling complex protein PhoU [Oscillospiraceae bacterium]